jgi:Mg-chelatase subunit ChlD
MGRFMSAMRKISGHSLKATAAPASPGSLMLTTRRLNWMSVRAALLKLSPLLAGFSTHGKGTLTAETVKVSKRSAHARISSSNKKAHVYFLLDRSGSMAKFADDVIGGFNAFVKEQQTESSDSTGLDMTLVQFDSMDPQEVVFSARDIDDVPPLCEKKFQPRGMTPLFDAMGGVISLAEAGEEARGGEEQIVVVTFSDGMENASTEHSRSSVVARVEAKQKEGWTFVFLGANQDSYATGGGLGMKGANIQNFAHDAKGTQEAWSAMSGATQLLRRNIRLRQYNNEDRLDLMLRRPRQCKQWSGIERIIMTCQDMRFS